MVKVDMKNESKVVHLKHSPTVVWCILILSLSIPSRPISIRGDMHDNDILRMRYWNGVKLDQVSLRRLSVLSTLSGVCH
jgi:hypothetical protein